MGLVERDPSLSLIPKAPGGSGNTKLVPFFEISLSLIPWEENPWEKVRDGQDKNAD